MATITQQTNKWRDCSSKQKHHVSLLNKVLKICDQVEIFDSMMRPLMSEENTNLSPQPKVAVLGK